jgi:hypothetical protein
MEINRDDMITGDALLRAGVVLALLADTITVEDAHALCDGLEYPVQ